MWQLIRRCSLPLFLLLRSPEVTAVVLPGLLDTVRDAVSPARSIQRVANDNLRLPLAPGGFRYITDLPFALTFDQPVGISSPPGETNRLFVLEKPGKIVVIPNLAAPRRQVFLDLSDKVFHEQECGLLGIAFHPQFARNRYFYVIYTWGGFWAVQVRLARFEVSLNDPNTALPDSETLLYTLFDGDPWHEGGDLHFGPDGYLYVSVGDGGYASQHVQRIDAGHFSGILRLDVDKRPGNPAPNPYPGVTDNYAIPADNPFVGATRFNGVPVDPERVRTEYFVIGLRNPWRFSFDPHTGDLYSNDTGSDYREEINVILKGVNYGWPFTEGSLTHTNVVGGAMKPSILFPPLSEYGYEGGGASLLQAGFGKAITAGLLYRGTNLPALDGAYLFSDFWTGDIGLIRPGASDSMRAMNSIQNEIQLLENVRPALNPKLSGRQSEWEKSWLQTDRTWTVLKPHEAATTSGISLVEQPDQSLTASGDVPWQDSYTVTTRTDLTNITGLRLELLPDKSLPGRGPGRSSGGNMVLSEIEIQAAPASDLAARETVDLAEATADHSQFGWEVGKAADGDLATGWAIAPALGQPHQAVFQFKRPAGFPGGTVLSITLHQMFGGQTTIGRFRLAATSAAPTPKADVYPLIAEIARMDPNSRTLQQKSKLASYYASIDPVARTIQAQIEKLRTTQIETLNRRPLPIEWIAREAYISTFGIDPRNGDLLMADMANGVIRRLTSQTDRIASLPASLQDTGIFTDLASLTPAPGIVPYSVNVPFWADNAAKRRWFSVPELSQKIEFKRDGSWIFPSGTVWVKHFDLPITNANSITTRRLETRVLVRNANGVHGATYRWDATARKASLVPDEGMDEAITISDRGTIRTQVWHYPSRSQCLQCHTSTAGYALGFNTVQLNREVSYGDSAQNQILALAQAGYFSSAIPNPSILPALADAGDASVSREYRVRSYLQANCVQCHQPGGPARSVWDARITTPTGLTGLIDGPPVHGALSPADRIIASGSVERSVLWQRLSALDQTHMPPLGTSLVNSAALALLSDWIAKDLASHETYVQWQYSSFEDEDEEAGPTADPDGDGVSNYAEYVLGTDPLMPSNGLKISIKRLEHRTLIRFPRIPNLNSQVEWTSDPADPISWAPLAVRGNAPFYPVVASNAVIEDLTAGPAARFYRVIVRQP